MSISDILDFLNKNAGAFSVIFTAVVTIATISYAILTYWLVKETALMRQVQTEPKIEITVRSHEVHFSIVRLYVRNIGLGPALKVMFNPRVIAGGNIASELIESFTEANFFKVGFEFFGPGKEVVSGYTEMSKDSESKFDCVIGFDVRYESVTGKKYSENLIVDMSEHRGMRRIGGIPPLHSIAQNLERLQKDFNRITTHGSRVGVDMYTEKDRLKEKEELSEFFKEELDEKNVSEK